MRPPHPTEGYRGSLYQVQPFFTEAFFISSKFSYRLTVLSPGLASGDVAPLFLVCGLGGTVAGLGLTAAGLDGPGGLEGFGFGIGTGDLAAGSLGWDLMMDSLAYICPFKLSATGS